MAVDLGRRCTFGGLVQMGWFHALIGVVSPYSAARFLTFDNSQWLHQQLNDPAKTLMCWRVKLHHLKAIGFSRQTCGNFLQEFSPFQFGKCFFHQDVWKLVQQVPFKAPIPKMFVLHMISSCVILGRTTEPPPLFSTNFDTTWPNPHPIVLINHPIGWSSPHQVDQSLTTWPWRGEFKFDLGRVGEFFMLEGSFRAVHGSSTRPSHDAWRTGRFFREGWIAWWWWIHMNPIWVIYYIEILESLIFSAISWGGSLTKLRNCMKGREVVL